jgi:putative membrane protein
VPGAAQRAAPLRRRLAITHFLARLVVNIAAFFFIVYVFPADGHITVANLTAAIIAGIIFGLVNAIIRPILLLLSAPLIILTLGLFALIVNTAVLYIVAWFYPAGLQLQNFTWAFVGALILSLISMLLSHLVKEVETERTAT